MPNSFRVTTLYWIKSGLVFCSQLFPHSKVPVLLTIKIFFLQKNNPNCNHILEKQVSDLLMRDEQNILTILLLQRLDTETRIFFQKILFSNKKSWFFLKIVFAHTSIKLFWPNKILVCDQLFRHKHKICIKKLFRTENRDNQICNMMTEILSSSDM